MPKVIDSISDLIQTNILINFTLPSSFMFNLTGFNLEIFTILL